MDEGEKQLGVATESKSVRMRLSRGDEKKGKSRGKKRLFAGMNR